MPSPAVLEKYAPAIADFIRFCLLVTSLIASGCGGAPTCARSTECRRGSVCDLQGHCGRLRPPSGARFASSRWLGPTDWGTAGSPGPLTDAIPLGGAAEGLLAFGPMPESSRILRALLVLHPHPNRPRVAEPAELIVERVGAFRGGALPARSGTQPTVFAAARRAVPAGPAHAIRLDVTEAARSRGAQTLHLLVRLDGRDPLAFASPWAIDPRQRPRLELMVR